MKMKLAVVFLAIAMCAAMLTAAFAREDDSLKTYAGKTVILYTGDVHGGINGYARLAALKKDLQESGAFVLLLDAGDYIRGQEAVNLSAGENVAMLMNQCGYDAAGLGRHEFDYGSTRLMELEKDMQFSLLAANLLRDGQMVFRGWETFMCGEYKVGIFGLTTPETAARVPPGRIEGLTFLSGEELVACAQAQIAALQKEHCDLILCLGSLGSAADTQSIQSEDIIRRVEDIDLYIESGSHSAFSRLEGKTIYGAAGAGLQHIGMAVFDGKTLRAGLIEGYQHEDEAVKRQTEEILATAAAEGRAVFATTAKDLLGETEAISSLRQETNLGDLAADALCWRGKRVGLQVDGALVSGGNIRANLLTGNITRDDVQMAFPSGDSVYLIQAKGSQLLAALETAVGEAPESSKNFPQVSGILYTIDTTAADARVAISEVGGKKFSTEEQYMIAAEGGLAAFFDVKTAYDLGETTAEILVSYVSDYLGGRCGPSYGNPQGRIQLFNSSFLDVPMYTWYNTYILEAVERGIMHGVTDTAFAPDDCLTRAQLAVLLYRMSGSPTEAGAGAGTFTDCCAGAWYADAVSWAAQKGLITGDGSGCFRPGDAVSREELAVLLCRCGGGQAVAGASTFADADTIGAWAEDAVRYCEDKGVFTGLAGNRFAPKEQVTRAQAAKVFQSCADWLL